MKLLNGTFGSGLFSEVI